MDLVSSRLEKVVVQVEELSWLWQVSFGRFLTVQNSPKEKVVLEAFVAVVVVVVAMVLVVVA